MRRQSVVGLLAAALVWGCIFSGMTGSKIPDAYAAQGTNQEIGGTKVSANVLETAGNVQKDEKESREESLAESTESKKDKDEDVAKEDEIIREDVKGSTTETTEPEKDKKEEESITSEEEGAISEEESTASKEESSAAFREESIVSDEEELEEGGEEDVPESSDGLVKPGDNQAMIAQDVANIVNARAANKLLFQCSEVIYGEDKTIRIRGKAICSEADLDLYEGGQISLNIYLVEGFYKEEKLDSIILDKESLAEWSNFVEWSYPKELPKPVNQYTITVRGMGTLNGDTSEKEIFNQRAITIVLEEDTGGLELNIPIRTIDGDEYMLYDISDFQPVVLVFGSSSCSKTWKTVDNLNKAAEAYDKDAARFIFLDVSQMPSLTQNFAKAFPNVEAGYETQEGSGYGGYRGLYRSEAGAKEDKGFPDVFIIKGREIVYSYTEGEGVEQSVFTEELDKLINGDSGIGGEDSGTGDSGSGNEDSGSGNGGSNSGTGDSGSGNEDSGSGNGGSNNGSGGSGSGSEDSGSGNGGSNNGSGGSGSGNGGSSSGSGSSGGSSSSSGSSDSNGGYSNKSAYNVPSYVVKGDWTVGADGKWSFKDAAGNPYIKQWGAIYNPYADTVAGMQNYDWFWFDETGAMITGWFVDPVNGYTYYLNPQSDGTMGRMMTGWVVIDGKEYYFNSESDGTRGRMFRNETTPDGHKVDANGVKIQ
ncbi:hypothetical protein AALB16_11320 [Lachnospiraceae bacterium 62-35]